MLYIILCNHINIHGPIVTLLEVLLINHFNKHLEMSVTDKVN